LPPTSVRTMKGPPDATVNVAASSRPGWLPRCGPELCAVLTVGLVGTWFVAVVTGQFNEFTVILDGFLAVGLVGTTIVLFWDRRTRARLGTPTPA
jgi:hypothetical protein